MTDGVEQNKDAVRQHHERLNRGDVKAAVLDFAEDAMNHGRSVGRKGIRRVLDDTYNTFPDFRMEIAEMVAEGDTVVVRRRASGTHSGVGRLNAAVGCSSGSSRREGDSRRLTSTGEGHYEIANLEAALAAFRNARAVTVERLRSVSDTQLARAGLPWSRHPRRGTWSILALPEHPGGWAFLRAYAAAGGVPIEALGRIPF